MKIRFLKGTTLAGGVGVNPGEVHVVSADDAYRFVKIFRDAEYVVDAPEPVKAEAPTVATTDEVPAEESKKGKKKL